MVNVRTDFQENQVALCGSANEMPEDSPKAPARRNSVGRRLEKKETTTTRCQLLGRIYPNT